MIRLLIVEEALKDRIGHWYEYNKAIVNEARRNGAEVTLLAHRKILDDLREELDAIPFFPVTSWDQVYNHRSPWRRYVGILRHNREIAALLTKHFKQQNTPYDIVLVPTTVLFHWLAWRWLVFRGSGRWFRKVVLTTRNNAGEYDVLSGSYRFRGSSRVLAKVLRSFAGPVSRGEVELASDSVRLAEQHSRLGGVRFETYCHPRTSDHLPLSRRETREETVFTALGPPRYEKGSDLILFAVEHLLRDQPDFPARFVIQWNSDVFFPDGRECRVSEFLSTHPKVSFIRTALTTEEYQRWLDGSDYVLLPYRREQYHARLSGIAIEAFQSGASCICISDTWVETCMNEIGKGIAMKTDQGEELRDSIIQAAAEREPLMTAEDIVKARVLHSPSAFVRKLGILRTAASDAT